MKKSALYAFLSLAIVAIIYAIFLIDWCDANEGLHYAAAYLGLNSSHIHPFPVWGTIVGLVGDSFRALSIVSLVAMVINAAIVAFAFNRIFSSAVHRSMLREHDSTRLNFAISLGTALGVFAFALSPYMFIAATRVSPLGLLILPMIISLALLVKMIVRSKYWSWELWMIIALAVYTILEVYSAANIALSMMVKPLLWFLAAGFLPGAVVASLIRSRQLKTTWQVWGGNIVWAGLVIIAFVSAFSRQGYYHGSTASEIVQSIIELKGEHKAIVANGEMVDMLGFMEKDLKVIDMMRNRDPAYGRELAKWAKEMGLDDDLIFAAELGPMALMDEWSARDKASFEKLVIAAPTYFPTKKDWEKALDQIKNLDGEVGIDRLMRHLLGVTGNHIGCRLLDAGDTEGAWSVFWRVFSEIEKDNYGAVINLVMMVERGHEVGKRVKEILDIRRRDIESTFKTREAILWAARTSGRIYIESEEIAEAERKRREELAKNGLSPEAQKFVDTIQAAPKSPKDGVKAREAIMEALKGGKINLRAIGSELITIDIALGDMEEAEKDAIEVLRVDRHNVVANTLMGSLRGSKGDYASAERYFKRAIATGKPSLATKNDYAMTLMRLGQYGLAEDFAREVVVAMPEAWNLRETLAAILVRAGKIAEAEREIAKIDELLNKAKIAPSRVVSLEIDRALVYKAKGEKEKLAKVKRSLEYRENLTDVQRAEIEAL